MLLRRHGNGAVLRRRQRLLRQWSRARAVGHVPELSLLHERPVRDRLIAQYAVHSRHLVKPAPLRRATAMRGCGGAVLLRRHDDRIVLRRRYSLLRQWSRAGTVGHVPGFILLHERRVRDRLVTQHAVHSRDVVEARRARHRPAHTPATARAPRPLASDGRRLCSCAGAPPCGHAVVRAVVQGRSCHEQGTRPPHATRRN